MQINIRVTKTIIALKLSVLLFFFTIGARLVYLQIHQKNHYQIISRKNFTRINSIAAIRGSILDHNGNFLATNRPVIDLYWQGSGSITLTQQQQKTIYLLQKILQLKFDSQTIEHIASAERIQKELLLTKDIGITNMLILHEQTDIHQNIKFKKKSKRYYPLQNNCCHVIGYVGNTNEYQIGQYGLEKKFDQILQGIPGTEKNSINAQHKIISTVQTQPSIQAKPIITTIDSTIQTIAQQVFTDKHVGACIVMNPETGAIRALVSRPHFDPTLFLDSFSEQQWQQLQINNPFLNRATMGLYPPGSIFKLIIMSAALEHEIIKPNTNWHCPGYTFCGKRKYWCHRKWGHGNLSTMQALAHSCNILFYEIGKQIDIDLVAQYAFMFGFGQKTGICLQENVGLVPSRNWKQTKKGESWWQGETLSVAIGQSFLLATPLQITRMIGAIFTGFLITPRLLDNEPIVKKELTISPGTRNFLIESMRSVVKQGTAKGVGSIAGMEIFAKTSTAQTSNLKHRSTEQLYLEHGWFVGYFQYKNNEPLVLVFLIEHAGTSRVPTLLAKNFLIAYKKTF